MDTLIYIAVGVVVLFGLWRVCTADPTPPDDPWMLANRHKLAHHFSDKFDNTAYDATKQDAAAKKRTQRDAQLSAVRKRHTDPPAVPVIIALRQYEK